MRFFQASLFHGILAAMWTGLWAYPETNFTKIWIAGGPGTYLFIAYITYLVIGFLGMAAFGAAYYLIPQMANKPLYNENLALAHFALMNLGVLATWVLALVGITGGSLIMAGARMEVVHLSIAVYEIPLGGLMVLGILGVLVGALNLFLTTTKTK
mgnify:CR=1 FL=1